VLSATPACPCRPSAAAAAKTLLKAVMPSVMEPQRPLSTIRLPGRGQPAICAVRQEATAEGGNGSGPAQETRLAVATGEGLLYSYRLELPAPASADSSSSGLRHSLEGEWQLTAPPR
jgi:hypothetical protein